MNLEYTFIRNLFSSYYYQTVWEDFENDQEIWQEYLINNSKENINNLIEEINEFSSLDDSFIMNKINEYTSMGGTSFDDINSVKDFLRDLKLFLAEKLS